MPSRGHRRGSACTQRLPIHARVEALDMEGYSLLVAACGRRLVQNREMDPRVDPMEAGRWVWADGPEAGMVTCERCMAGLVESAINAGLA